MACSDNGFTRAATLVMFGGYDGKLPEIVKADLVAGRLKILYATYASIRNVKRFFQSIQSSELYCSRLVTCEGVEIGLVAADEAQALSSWSNDSFNGEFEGFVAELKQFVNPDTPLMALTGAITGKVLSSYK